MYAAWDGGRELVRATHARFCRRGNRLDVGRHGQLLAVEAVLRSVGVDVAEGREIVALLDLGRVGFLVFLRSLVVLREHLLELAAANVEHEGELLLTLMRRRRRRATLAMLPQQDADEAGRSLVRSAISRQGKSTPERVARARLCFLLAGFDTAAGQMSD